MRQAKRQPLLSGFGSRYLSHSVYRMDAHTDLGMKLRQSQLVSPPWGEVSLGLQSQEAVAML